MLTKRAQILFNTDLWNQITRLATEKKISVSELVREALKEKLVENKIQATRRKAIESTLKHRKIFKGQIDYEELINYGRER
ncbi:MAG: hypothetical protein Q7R43_01500 [Candidatus Daviesbacteria bacterium]|nr:hypothetical protein [Candidatus Daviesbacteria bacterium]